MRGWRLFFLLLFLLLLLSAIAWILFSQIRARRSGLPPPTWRSYLPFIRSRGSSGSNSGGFSNLPSPRSTNPLEWLKDKLTLLRQGRNRTAQGHYEEAGGYPGGGSSGTAPPPYAGASSSRRPRGTDPDEAWDTRVGNEADAYAGSGPGGYHEEQELGPTSGRANPYAGAAAAAAAAMPAYGEGADPRGRSKSRDPPPSGVMGAQGRLDTRYELETGGKSSQQQRGLDASNPFSDANEAPSLRGVSPRPGPELHGGPESKGKGGGGPLEDSPSERRSMFRESL
jgi:hypothetical protein